MIRTRLAVVLLALSGAAFAGKHAPSVLHLTHSWQVSMDAHGKVLALAGVDELEPAVRDPLERAIRSWNFEPGSLDGQPVATRTMLTLDVDFVPVEGDRYSVRIRDARTGGIIDDSRSKAAPRFPREARKPGLFAMVVVEAKYAADGSIVAVEPLPQHGIHSTPALERATIAAVKRWFVTPERVGGRAVASSVLVPICYTVTRGPSPPDFTCSFTPPGSSSTVTEGGTFALAPVARLRSDVIGRTL